MGETSLSQIFGVGGYPTLKWFVRGRPIDYEGPRLAKEIAKWIEVRLSPAYSDVDAADDIAGAVEASQGAEAKICAGAGSKESDHHTAFEAAAEHFRGKVLFVWAPEGAHNIILHRKGRDPILCDNATACTTADGVISW